jgi:2-polyprenyl-3-methyl-5-hydroxy-6-metoxy-1,4-benzoquinol methylase
MDDPSLDPELHAAALRGLARINVVSRASAPLWKAIEPLAVRANALGTSLTVLDIATGSADVPLALAGFAKARGVGLELHACDISSRALEHAAERAKNAGVTLRTFEADVLHGALPGVFDVVTCSLFLHHLDEADVVAVLAAMRAAARQQVVVSDLRRTRLGLALATVVPKVLTRSPVVHTDAVLSARAAWTIEELSAMAARAGMPGCEIRPCWPSRMALTWSPPGANA